MIKVVLLFSLLFVNLYQCGSRSFDQAEFVIGRWSGVSVEESLVDGKKIEGKVEFRFNFDRDGKVEIEAEFDGSPKYNDIRKRSYHFTNNGHLKIEGYKETFLIVRIDDDTMRIREEVESNVKSNRTGGVLVFTTLDFKRLQSKP